ncbi:MAG: DUF3857 domain-containing protein [Candidatus Aceula meridiana]|nr:DUF3857 domain-containing protein [Candidatus Aceula meridiana]
MMVQKYKVIIFSFVVLFLCSCQSKEDPSSKGSPVENANVFSQMSDEFYQKAIDGYRLALETQPASKDKIYYQLGKLYYENGKYELAIENLIKSGQDEAKKLLAIAYYKSGNYTDALTVFEKVGEQQDSEYLFYYAATCEIHNLHTEAIKLYNKITPGEFQERAKDRIQKINALKENTNLDGIDPKIKELIVNSPTQEDFPQAGAIVLYLKEKVEVNDDNTIEYTEHYLIKILNERGKGSGEVQASYDSTYEKVEVELARTIKPDGQVISVGDKHIRDVSKYLNFPLYSNARVKIISMPEVSIGSFLEYKIRGSRSKMIAEDKFRSTYFLESDNPIQHAEFSIVLPQGQKLHQRNLNEEFNDKEVSLAPEVETLNGKTTYSWKFENVDQIIPEPKMPPISESTPIVVLTTFNSWDEIYSWWWPLAKEKIKANQDMRDKIAEMTDERMSLKQKAKEIYNFCAKDIRYVGIEYGAAGYEPHFATEIFANKYGDCKDQSILLIAMLKEAGVTAYPVLIGTRGVPKIQEDFPTLMFNHCIAVAEIDGEYIFMDPTGETVLFGDLPAGDQGRKVFTCLKDKPQLMDIPKFSAIQNTINQKTVLSFQENEEIAATREVRASGIFDQAQRGWLRYTMPILVKQKLQQRIQEIIPGSKLLDYKIKNLEQMKDNIVLSYNFEGSDFFIKAGPSMRVIPQLGSIGLSTVSKPNRRYPIDFSVPYKSVSVFEIDLSKSYRIKSLPQPVVSNNDWFVFENTYEKVGNKIIFTQRNTIKKERIEASDYLAYKILLEKLSKDIRQSIILEKQ